LFCQQPPPKRPKSTYTPIPSFFNDQNAIEALALLKSSPTASLSSALSSPLEVKDLSNALNIGSTLAASSSSVGVQSITSSPAFSVSGSTSVTPYTHSLITTQAYPFSQPGAFATQSMSSYISQSLPNTSVDTDAKYPIPITPSTVSTNTLTITTPSRVSSTSTTTSLMAPSSISSTTTTSSVSSSSTTTSSTTTTSSVSKLMLRILVETLKNQKKLEQKLDGIERLVSNKLNKSDGLVQAISVSGEEGTKSLFLKLDSNVNDLRRALAKTSCKKDLCEIQLYSSSRSDWTSLANNTLIRHIVNAKLRYGVPVF